MEKIQITNRKRQHITAVIQVPNHQDGLAFIMHGLGGFKEQKHIQVIAESFLEHGYTAVRFDTTNTFGESDGAYELSTTTNYYEDLEDVIRWAASRPWYQCPFVLAGHSLGAMCVSLFAERYPEMVCALAPISPVVDGNHSILACEVRDPGRIARWKESGWLEEVSYSKPQLVKRLPWSHMEDRLQYNIVNEATRLVMPTLVVVGEKDATTPVEHVRTFFDALPAKKEFHIIPGAHHTFREGFELVRVKKVLKKWIVSLDRPGASPKRLLRERRKT